MVKSKVFTFSETSSRTQTQTITINNLKSISKVTTNTGTAVVQNLSGNVGTIQLSGGSASRTVQTGGSYTPGDSKSVSDTRLSDTGAPSSISYNSGGYSGTLSLTGSENTNTLGLIRYFYSGTVYKPASDTRTYTSYYQYTITVEYVDNDLPTIQIATTNGQVISESQIIIHRDKVDFSFDIMVNDTDVDDTLQYNVLFNNVEQRVWTNIDKNTKIKYTLPFSSLLIGNNLVAINVKDNNDGNSSINFTLRTLSPESYCNQHIYNLIKRML